MRKTKRIILVGPGASGKDYLSDKLIEAGLLADVSMTTRPKRDGEVEDVTYHFASEKEFQMNIDLDKFYENIEFNGWKYGTLNKYWAMADVFIMTPSGVRSITLEDRDGCTVVYLDINEKDRILRMDKRSDADKTERRIKADKKAFLGFIDYDYRINTTNFNATEWVKILIAEMKRWGYN